MAINPIPLGGRAQDPGIKPSQKKFYDFANLVWFSSAVTNTTTTLYTVPQGRYFFMVGFSINAMSTGANTGSVNLQISQSSQFLGEIGSPGATGSATLSESFPVLLKFLPGTKFIIQSTSPALLGRVHIQGYEIQEEIASDLF